MKKIVLVSAMTLSILMLTACTSNSSKTKVSSNEKSISKKSSTSSSIDKNKKAEEIYNSALSEYNSELPKIIKDIEDNYGKTYYQDPSTALMNSQNKLEFIGEATGKISGLGSDVVDKWSKKLNDLYTQGNNQIQETYQKELDYYNANPQLKGQ